MARENSAPFAHQANGPTNHNANMAHSYGANMAPNYKDHTASSDNVNMAPGYMANTASSNNTNTSSKSISHVGHNYLAEGATVNYWPVHPASCFLSFQAARYPTMTTAFNQQKSNTRAQETAMHRPNQSTATNQSSNRVSSQGGLGNSFSYAIPPKRPHVLPNNTFNDSTILSRVQGVYGVVSVNPTIINFLKWKVWTRASDGSLKPMTANRGLKARSPFDQQQVSGILRDIAAIFMLPRTKILFELTNHEISHPTNNNPIKVYLVRVIHKDYDGPLETLYTGHAWATAEKAIQEIQDAASEELQKLLLDCTLAAPQPDFILSAQKLYNGPSQFAPNEIGAPPVLSPLDSGYCSQTSAAVSPTGATYPDPAHNMQPIGSPYFDRNGIHMHQRPGDFELPEPQVVPQYYGHKFGQPDVVADDTASGPPDGYVDAAAPISGPPDGDFEASARTPDECIDPSLQDQLFTLKDSRASTTEIPNDGLVQHSLYAAHIGQTFEKSLAPTAKNYLSQGDLGLSSDQNNTPARWFSDTFVPASAIKTGMGSGQLLPLSQFDEKMNKRFNSLAGAHPVDFRAVYSRGFRLPTHDTGRDSTYKQPLLLPMAAGNKRKRTELEDLDELSSARSKRSMAVLGKMDEVM